MNKQKLSGLIITIVIVCILAVFAFTSLMVTALTPHTPTGEFHFTISGSSDCPRFLNSSVSTVYVPFTVAANENYQLTVNCTKMPGGVNGWTDVYLYNGYWDAGTNHICAAGDLYRILSDIQSTDFAIRADQPYTATFGGATQQSYTIFFGVPPRGILNIPSILQANLGDNCKFI